MIDTKELKRRILDFAIRGYLTEQREEDGTAEELYQRIQEQKLIIQKSKKGNELASYTDSPASVPFEIPKSWKWVKLNEICSQITDGTHKTPTYQQNGIPFLSVKNISSGCLDLTDIKYISKEEHSELIKRCKPEKNDILICRIGTLGKALRIDTDIGFSIFVSLGLIKIGDQVLADYIINVINSGFGADWIQAIKAGGAMHAYKINLSDLNEMLIPLPPYEEQKRIEDSVNDLFTSLNTIDTLQSQYQDNLATLKSKIIDAGIQGKLTEQLPEDGTAEELYQQIQQEKLALEKAGKIKKSKPLPPISDEEKPFDIPENWKWVRFSDLMLTISTGPFGSMLHKSDYVNNGIPLINPMNIVDGKIIPSEKMMVSEESRFRLASYVLHEGMIVMGRRGEMGRCAIVNKSEDGWLCGTGSFFMEPSNCILVQYVIVLLSTIYAKTYLGGQSIGMTMSNLNHTILTKMPIPLPPLAEQKRIVAKLKELLPLCD